MEIAQGLNQVYPIAPSGTFALDFGLLSNRVDLEHNYFRLAADNTIILPGRSIVELVL